MTTIPTATTPIDHEHVDHRPSETAYCDVLFANATVHDGSGAPPREADVAITGDRIVACGNLTHYRYQRRIDARGLALAPGFIDAHTHDDRAIFSTPDMSPKVSQGVTSVIAGNCGVSIAPAIGREPPPPLNLLGDSRWFRFANMHGYFSAVDAEPGAVNIAMLVGHSTLRAATMDQLDRPATPEEIDRMGLLIDEAMAAGCLGLSTGLAYPTAIHAPTDEIIALTRRAAAGGGIYTTHMRNEDEGVVASVEETVAIGSAACAHSVISHHKACGRPNWGLTTETLARIDAANANGQQVDFDVYPYTASSTVLLANFVARAERVLITWSTPHPEMSGKDLADITSAWGCSTEAAIVRLQPAGAIYFQMDEADLRRVLQHPGSMIGSDGIPHDEHPHPRLWGTFPRVLGHYARDEGLFPIETAIYKMTGLPARVFGLADRGRVAPGMFADLVLFDAKRVIDKADFAAPTTPSTGIERVMVNGQFVWEHGEATGARPGKALRRT